MAYDFGAGFYYHLECFGRTKKVRDENLDNGIIPIFMEYINCLDNVGGTAVRKVVPSNRSYNDVV